VCPWLKAADYRGVYRDLTAKITRPAPTVEVRNPVFSER